MHCSCSPLRPTADDVNAMSQSLDTLLCNKCKNQSESLFFFLFPPAQLHKRHQRSGCICAVYAVCLMAAIKPRAFTALPSHDMNKQTAMFPPPPWLHLPSRLISVFVPHRWQNGLLRLPEVRVLRGEHRVLVGLRGLQDQNVTRRHGVQGQQHLRRVHQKRSPQRGKKQAECFKSELIGIIAGR